MAMIKVDTGTIVICPKCQGFGKALPPWENGAAACGCSGSKDCPQCGGTGRMMVCLERLRDP